MGGEKPEWISNWEKNTRQGKDSLDWFFRGFNRTKIYEYCLKSTPRFLTLCVVGSIVGTYAWSRMWENIWMRANRGRLYKDCPYVYPAEE